MRRRGRRGWFMAGPVTLVEAWGARSRWRWRRTLLRPAGRSAFDVARRAADHLSENVEHIARGSRRSRRRRRRLLQKARRRIDRVSNVANHIGTLLGVAAAGAELVSALRDHDGGARGAGAHVHANGKRDRQRKETLEGVR